MLINSHLVIASILEPYVKPVNIEEYYLGSIAPDIRYYADIPRNQTHIPLEDIVDFATQYPHLASFVLGYMIHCASETLPRDAGLNEAIFQQFPFSVKSIQRKLPKSFVSVVLSFYHLEHHRVQAIVSESGNEMLRDLGITDHMISGFTGRFNRFLEQPSLESGMGTLQDLGLLGNEGVRRYLRIAQYIKNGLIKRWLFSVVREPINDFHQKSVFLLLATCEHLIR